jgi:hypothetical protein
MSPSDVGLAKVPLTYVILAVTAMRGLRLIGAVLLREVARGSLENKRG